MDTASSPLTQAIPFGRGPNGEMLFVVQPGIPIDTALTHASELLDCVGAVVYESASNASEEFRPLARSAVYQLEAIRALLLASLNALAAR
ncbi:DUF3077 domain-containing protein [Pseudomonas sp. HR96]|uniref:DUF6124 family protein n=1 Tax=Pseudomonas sp. HR96 TaxID=1027966 RepID=UPI002A7591DF|nr:DUF3077 domain-containing protein [Pseudomonas sp. HR96]WPO97604.1 DUF3077 domain-containing protein [Pseudomonas sp. HR96]